jgi:hypothetical protein
MPPGRCRCKICMRDKGKSRWYPHRAAVVKHRRRAHPKEPKVRNWSKEAAERRAGGLPTKPKGKAARPANRHCTQCGRRRGSGWRYCGGCGTMLRT